MIDYLDLVDIYRAHSPYFKTFLHGEARHPDFKRSRDNK